MTNQLPESLSWVNRFKKYSGNPILRPQGDGCAADAIFNPAAIVHDGKVKLLCRAINMARPRPKDNWSVSSLVWAESDDGFHFKLADRPAFDPDENSPYQGGFEDPRLVEIDGKYILTFTGVKDAGHTPGMMAVSDDLEHWDVLGEVLPGRAIAIVNQKIGGKYWAYWGNDPAEHLAWSEDLRTWHVHDQPAFTSRPGCFDGLLCEAAAAPIVTDDGILLFYNGAASHADARAYAERVLPMYEAPHQYNLYSTGWALFDRNDPTRLIARCDRPILEPYEIYELFGIANYTVFSQGFVDFKGKKLIYFGCADMRIGVAVAE